MSSIFSFIIVKKSTVQLVHKVFFTQVFDVLFAEWYTAKKDILINKRSIHFHQKGNTSLCFIESFCTIKKNGVAKQCIIHNVLANAPILSDLLYIVSAFIYKF